MEKRQLFELRLRTQILIAMTMTVMLQNTPKKALKIREQYLQQAAVIQCSSASWHRKSDFFFPKKQR